MSPSPTNRESPRTCGAISSDERPCMTYRYRFLHRIRRNNRLWRTLSRVLVCVRAGASLLSALPIVVGSSLGRRPGASLIYPKASATSEWSRSEHSHYNNRRGESCPDGGNGPCQGSWHLRFANFRRRP